MNLVYDLAIVGAGAAGLMAASIFSKYNYKVLILERNERVGKKLLSTGNGTCNFSNKNVSGEEYNNPEFAKVIIERFNYEDSVRYFKNIGVETLQKEDRAYPISLQASSVLDSFRMIIEEGSVELRESVYIIDIYKKNSIFVLISDKGEKMNAKRILLTGGGMAMPKSGSDGNLYKIIKKFSHDIIAPVPGLVQFECSSPYLKSLDGLRIESELCLIENNKEVKREYGDILFTSYGLSGPTVFQLSRLINRNPDKNFIFSVDILSNIKMKELINILKYKRDLFSSRNIKDALIGIIHKRLIVAVIKEAKIDINKKISDLSENELENLAFSIKNFNLNITKDRGFGYAQLTLGGVDTSYVNPHTMESKKEEGLYFAGEILDIDGPCGGYNLHFAFASAYVASKAILEMI